MDEPLQNALEGMSRNERVFLAALVVTLLAVTLLATYEANINPTKTSTLSSARFVTGTSVASESDIFLTACAPSGPGFWLRILSDSTGAPVSGETVNAVDKFECSNGQSTNSQIVYLDNFSVGEGGWLTPVWPRQAVNWGTLNFTITYEGGTWNFSAEAYNVGLSCVTLHVPSGNVTQKVTSGSCS
jgi:hypothetical protein